MKSLYLLLCFLFILVISACSLEEDPPSNLAPTNFYTSGSDAIAAVSAVYDIFNQIGDQSRNLIIMGDIPSDDANPLPINADRVQISNFQTAPTNGVVLQSWQVLYQGVNRANTAIERIPNIAMDAKLQARLIGEAKFMRAVYYFYLVRWYGGVPLMLTETVSLDAGKDVARASAEEVYAQIIKDLTEAEAVLPEIYTGADLGRATAGAVKAMLAKVYLTIKDFTKARDKAQEVITNAAKYKYGLFSTYAEVFAVSNKNGKEGVFEMQFVGGGVGQGNGMITYFAIENSPVTGRGFGSFFPTAELYNSYAPGDKRKELYINSYVNNAGQTITTYPHFNKYVDPAARAFPEGNNNFPIIRYADVLLMFAEASNEVTGPSAQAIEYVNQIRRRAFGFPLDAPSSADLSTGLSQEEFRNKIYEERRWEFTAEGQRWFDLVRTGRLVNVLKTKGKTNVAEKHNLFPIPQREIDLNPKLQQNPGY
ncbi:MAG: RagB/SusD family nutrient uptake outer membrane protein [Saprospiraceae bacterium]